MDNRRQTAAAPVRRQVRFLLLGVLALTVLIGAGFYVAHSLVSPGPAAGRATAGTRTEVAGCGATAAAPCPGSAVEAAIAAPPTTAKLPPHPTRTGSSPTTSQSPSASASPPPTTPVTTRAASTQPSASAAQADPAAAQGDPAAAQEDPAEAQVLALINQARATAALPALTVTSDLETTSSAHNLKMADGCGLSHQCPGEPATGDREIAAGVDWTSEGENIGDGGPVTDTSAAIAQMAVGITQSMLDEKPPNDGHRKNILSTAYTHVGIAVYRDASGTVWLTQDFSS
jgi:uncharacterized protein YkwD